MRPSSLACRASTLGSKIRSLKMDKRRFQNLSRTQTLCNAHLRAFCVSSASTAAPCTGRSLLHEQSHSFALDSSLTAHQFHAKKRVLPMNLLTRRTFGEGLIFELRPFAVSEGVVAGNWIVICVTSRLVALAGRIGETLVGPGPIIQQQTR